MSEPYITAFAFRLEGDSTARYTVRVPVSLKGSTPTVPRIILFEKEYYLRTNTNPLEYRSASFGKAVRNGKRNRSRG